MSDQLKTVDEIMEMLREYKISHFDRSNQNAVGVAIRAAITDLHTAAARKQEAGIMSDEDIRHESCVSP